jgi:hypothetical protein
MLADTVFGGALGISGFSAPLASLIGASLALIAGIAVTYARTAPTKAELDYREAMRNPEGETIYDRAQSRAAAAAASARAEHGAAMDVSR